MQYAEEIQAKGKPRGRMGGRKPGSKDKAPRASKDLTEALNIRISRELLHRIERQALLEGDPVAKFVRNVLDREVV